MVHHQVFGFIDNLDTEAFKHVVLFYEEPEYARLVQIRFLSNGLKRGELCIYFASDDEDLQLMQTDMQQCGVDVANYARRGLLQLHMRPPRIENRGSHKAAREEYRKVIESTYLTAPNHENSMPDRIRGVGSLQPYIFASKNTTSRGDVASSQLLMEQLFHSEDRKSFSGIWMCKYQVANIIGSMDKEWMKVLLENHDAVLFLRKSYGGCALDLRK